MVGPALGRVPPVTFTLLPAVDVAGARAVRVTPAGSGNETTSGDPTCTALAWQADGAEWIHLVDVDAAFGRGSNAELLASIIGALDVRVELSGGIGDDRSLEQALATGCTRVILGTAALADPSWCARVIDAHGERIAVGLDVRVVSDADGSLHHRLDGRGGTGDHGDLWEVLERLDRDGCARYVVTDVTKDGMLRGPNVELYRSVTRATAAPVIASGGIAAIDDLIVLADLAAAGANLEGSIVGSALHTGRFTLPDAVASMRGRHRESAREMSVPRASVEPIDGRPPSS